MARSVTKGLNEIAIAPLAGDGGPGTVFVATGYTSRDSETSITTADPTVTEFYANESSVAVETTTTPGATTMQFSLMAMDEDDMILWLGGTKTGTGTGPDPYVFKKGSTQVELERSVRITPASGRIAIFNRVKLTAKINWNMGADGLFLVDVVGTVLQPLKAGVEQFNMKLPVTA